MAGPETLIEVESGWCWFCLGCAFCGGCSATIATLAAIAVGYQGHDLSEC